MVLDFFGALPTWRTAQATTARLMVDEDHRCYACGLWRALTTMVFGR